MPLCVLSTTLKDTEVPDDFDQQFIDEVASLLNKPPERIMLKVETSQRMRRGGSNEPLVWLFIHSIDVFDADRNPAYVQRLAKFVADRIPSVQPANVQCMFRDIKSYEVGRGK